MKILVVGAGITGLAAAVNLRRNDFEVTLIDRVEPGSPTQASFGNAGLLAKSGVLPVSTPGLLQKIPKMIIDPNSPLFIRWKYLPKLLPWLIPFLRAGDRDSLDVIVPALDSLTNDTLEQHKKLAKSTGAESYICQGDFALMYPGEKAFRKDGFSHALKADFGFPSKKLGRAEILELDEYISPKYNVAAIFNDHGWITNPGSYLRTIFKSFKANQGLFIKSGVKKIFKTGVTLENEEVILADRIVVATGAWSEQFGLGLGIKPRIESERGYHVFFKGSNRVPPFPMMVTDGKFIVTPMQGGIRCAGVVEFGGLNAPPSQAPLNLIRKKVKNFYEDLQFEEESIWMGHRPSTPDSLPLIGSTIGSPNVIWAVGGQHVGLTIGPKVGELVANMVMNKRPNIDLLPFMPDRFR